MGVITGIGARMYSLMFWVWIISTIILMAYLAAGLQPPQLLYSLSGPLSGVLVRLAEKSLQGGGALDKLITMAALAALLFGSMLASMYPSLMYSLAIMFGLGQLAHLFATIGALFQVSVWYYLAARANLVPDM